MEREVQSILREATEPGLPSMVIGGNAVNLPEFPVFDRPMIEPWPLAMSWSDAIRQMAPFRDYYMEHFDSPERRFADKNPEPFVL